MYLARVRQHRKTRFIIRESYQNGVQWQSRDLMDLGGDPAAFIVYPGGNAFYVDPDVLEQLEAKGSEPDPEELESLFWPFVDPEIRHRLDHFRTRSECLREARNRERIEEPDAFLPHLFDRRRIHYLRCGQMNQGGISRAPSSLFRVVRNKSRDEIEQYFLESERILKPHEHKTYVFVIFDLQQFFTERFAKTMPEALNPESVDGCFLEEICRLNQDRSFWGGMEMSDHLNCYLIRYLVMFFDSDYHRNTFLENFLRDFMDRHRRYRPPRSVKVSMAEAARLFATGSEELKRMTRSDLARLYRLRAKCFHPDQGGKKSEFIKLTEAYHKLLRTKR